MINGKTVLAVIPARGGSKRAPGKNIKLYKGKPLLAWSIEAAKASKYIDRLVVSTEDPAIKWVALSYGSEVVDRPPELANDTALNEDVIRHILKTDFHDWVVLLQPTSPSRATADIDGCLEVSQYANGCYTVRPNGTKNGAVYVARGEWIRYHDFTVKLPEYEMPEERSLDIDYPEEFAL